VQEKSRWCQNGRRSRQAALISLVATAGAALAAGPALASSSLIVDELSGVHRNATPPDTFTVDTPVPEVTLTGPPARSGDATPSFSGTATGSEPVTVSVYPGALPEGVPAAMLNAEVSNGQWISASVSPPLPDGEYTAVATQPGSIGNEAGVSAPLTFEVDSGPPTVTLNPLPPLTSDTAPSFSGTAQESTQVTVEVFDGTRPEGVPIAQATARGTGGEWVSGAVEPALPAGRSTFTAIAVQSSELGAGRSAPVTFTVDILPPAVTLGPPPSRSNDTAPSFSGDASEDEPVTVDIYAGSKPEGGVVATATAPAPSAEGGSWTSGQVTPVLPDGTFTAVATQPSAIENPLGESAPVTFSVDTEPPSVTLNALPSPSPDADPAFSGTASEGGLVTVDIYRGASADGAVVATATAEGDGGEWASGSAVAAGASVRLEWGEYTAVASQSSEIGNASGASPPITFTIEPIAPAVAT
jgi:large repetitive protein